MQQHVVWAEFIGTNPDFKIEKKIPSKEYTNYFLGNDKSKWVSNAYSYADIKYVNYYNNTDLRVYQKEGHLKYDFIINPSGKNNIKIKYAGQDKIKINRKGELIIETTLGQIIEEKPYAYQLINGEEKEIPCQFVLNNNVVSFSVGKYDKSLPLVIDPVLVFASYSGSTADNFGMTATYGNDGSLFAGGTTFNSGYPTTPGAYDATFEGTPSQGITDVVISRYNSTGTTLMYSTYIGGLEAETVHSMIANDNNELYIYGVTSSLDFPRTNNAYDNTFNGGALLRFVNNGTFFNNGTDIYVAKLNNTGTSLMGSTYIGGSANDGVNHSDVNVSVSPAYDSLQFNYGDQYRGEIFLDKDDNCYVTSSSRSSDFPTPNGFDTNLNGNQDGVVFKLDNNLSNLIWSSYIGGNSVDAGYGIRVDTSNVVYVSGGTASSAGFPITTGTLNQTYQGGKADGYLAKIASDGSSVLAATYIGTSEYDQCYFIDLDRFGSVYALGQTRGAFPVINANYLDPNSGSFIIKMDSNLSTINYSTVFGNGNVNAQFSPTAFLVDRCQNIYASGWGGNILGGSTLTGMRTTTNAIISATGNVIQTTSSDGFNFYLTVFERDLQSQLFGIYYGSPTAAEHVDGGTSRFDKNGIIYQSVCAGCGGDQDFPTTSGVVSNDNNSSNCNNGVFKFDFEILPKAAFSVNQFQGCAPLNVTFTNTSNNSDTYLWDFGGGDTTSQIFSPVRTYTTPGTYYVSLLIQDSICNTIDTAFQTIVVDPPVTVSGGNTYTTCEDTITLSINTTGPINQIVWSTNNQFTDTLNNNPLDSSLLINLNDTVWYYVMASNNECFGVDSFLINYPGFSIQTLNNTICEGEQITLSSSTSSNQNLIYNWTPINSIINGANTATPTVNPTSNTTYYVNVQNSFGCTVNDSLLLTVIPPVNISGGNTSSICDTTTLSISILSGSPTSIIWSSTNQFTDTLNTNLLATNYHTSITNNTWFYVMASNGFCSAVDSFLVNYIGFQITTPDGAICEGQDTSLSTIITPLQNLTYNWEPISQILSGANSANPNVNPDSTTTYTLTAQNFNGCIQTSTSTVFVSGFDPANITVFADNDTLYNGASTQLHTLPNTGFTYHWTPSVFLSNTTDPNPTTTPIPTTTITYTVELTEIGSNCSFNKSLTIYAYEILCGDPNVFLPNAFTPNNDGENDVLFVRGQTVEKVNLKIYDRWGELVFETNKQSLGWDGKYKGALVDPGVFVYHIEVTCIDGQEYFNKGNVTVIR